MTVRLRVWLQAGLAIFAIAVLCVVVQLSLVQLRGTLSAARQAQQVILDLGGIRSDTVDVEGAARDYLLSHQDVTSRPLEEITGAEPSRFAELRTLMGSDPSQLARLVQLGQALDRRMALVRQAIQLGRDGSWNQASQLLYNPAGLATLSDLRLLLQQLVAAADVVRIERREDFGEAQNVVETVIFGGAGVVAIMILLATIPILNRLGKPLHELLGAVEEFGEGRFETHLKVTFNDEVGRLQRAFNDMAQARLEARDASLRVQVQLQDLNESLTSHTTDLQSRTATMEALARIAERLQTAATEEEFGQVIKRYVPIVLGEGAGALYFYNNSRNLLVQSTEWGKPAGSPPHFAPGECWGLRRGGPHTVENAHTDVCCLHVPESLVPTYGCYPLTAQGETIGLLYLEGHVNADRVTVLAENISLAMSNLRLRNSLREQSIRDPMTGLFNRRYMEETLNMELSRNERTGQTLCVAMLDVDHFKRFNDTFGHDAGDVLLKAVARAMVQHFRGGDIVCRFGGEEFIVIMPTTSLEQATARADALRASIQELSVQHQGREIGPVTISIGVSASPLHGRDGDRLIQQADGALYQAKQAGRNRVLVADMQAGAVATSAVS